MNIDVNEPPGPYILVDEPVTWKYDVFNQGEVTLTDIHVTDNRDVTVTCPSTSLVPGGSMQCSASGLATAGQYSNTGTVTALTPYDTTIGNVDTSFYFGANPQTSLIKKTNDVIVDEPTDLFIEEGSEVTWTYEVSNTGNVD